jgi:hypothetical protein
MLRLLKFFFLIPNESVTNFFISGPFLMTSATNLINLSAASSNDKNSTY